MSKQRKYKSPCYTDLMVPTFRVLKELGGSGSNDEIRDAVAKDLQLPENILNEIHAGSYQTEFEYQLGWARTYLKKYGIISNSSRSVWAIEPEHTSDEDKDIDPFEIVRTVRNSNRISGQTTMDADNAADSCLAESSPENQGIESDETRPWRQRLSEVLKTMDPFAFERLSQRLLRECGFIQVNVTKKSGDGGIDGTGKLKINGLFSFNVAFQCKRYVGAVGAADIRNFRGSLTAGMEKGIFITTGTFTKDAIEEASNMGKQQIDLINGEEFINKLAEYEIGLREIKDYEIDEEFFRKI